MNDYELMPVIGQISVVIAAAPAITVMMAMSAQLLQKNTLHVIDGGNRFDGYCLARALRKHSPQFEMQLEHLLLTRAFTCHQMLTILNSFPVSTKPLLVLDLLATFMDENVTLDSRLHLLAQCLPQLRRLSTRAAVVIWLIPHHRQAEEERFFAQITRFADHLWQVEEPAPAGKQLSLF